MKLGIDLGGSHIGIGIVNEKGYVVEKVEKRLLSKDKKNIKNVIEEYIFEQVENFRKKQEVSLIGIAVPGTVSNNVVTKSVNLGLKNYPIVERLQQKINIPIQIANDCSCAALAENKYGAIKKYSREVFITLGTGIGGAVIIDDKLLNTGDLPGCEFGHMIIQKNGLECKCGKKGCFEKYASMKAFKDNLRKELGVDENTRGQELLDILRKNEKNTKFKKIIDEYIENLSIGLSNIVNIFEPEIIGIGGSFVFFSDILLEKLKKNIIEKGYLFNPRKEIAIVPAILGNDAGIIGSVITNN